MSVAVLRGATRKPEAVEEKVDTKFEYPGIPTTCDGAEAVVHVEIKVTQAAGLGTETRDRIRAEILGIQA